MNDPQPISNGTKIPNAGPRVGLFVTCLVDLLRPSVGFAAVKLLEDAGCRVEAPALQTCCGQPAFNNGDLPDTIMIAKQVIQSFADFDYVVSPSGSCIGMIKVHYIDLFAEHPEWQSRARTLADRCYELTSFLTDVLGVKEVHQQYEGSVTYHDSCSGLRELGIKQQPRRLLSSIRGLVLNEMQDAEVCCGFGGTFCVKYPEISGRMVTDKVANVIDSGAGTLVGGDLSCLLNIAGRIHRLHKPTRVYHIAELLAGMTNDPAIGEPGKR